MNGGRPPAVDAIWKGISARFDRSKKVIAVHVGQHPPATAEIGIDGGDISVVAMAIASTRIRLPHFDQRVGHRLTVAIENIALNYGLFSDRFSGLVLIIVHTIID